MGRQEERLAGVAPDLSFLLRTDKQFQFNRQVFYFILAMLFLYKIIKFFFSKIMYTFIRLAFEKAKLYTQRFETMRINYEVDTHTDPNTIKNEKGSYLESSKNL